MLYVSDKPQILQSINHEEPLHQIMVEFNQRERYNALMSEWRIPFAQRLALAKEPACIKRIIVPCITEAEAIKTAEYHFYSSGSNFKIVK